MNKLTKRQTEILKLLKKHSRPEVADKLQLSRKTIDAHLSTIFKILNVNNIKDALTYLRS